jgi:hypothetical protein
MKINISNIVNRYGACMGRASSKLSRDGRVYCQKMRMVDGAYDVGGAYWGCGNPLIGCMYVLQDCEGNQAFVRATSREKALEKGISLY